MKSTGIVRKMDELGRIVLPIELRRTMNINEGDPLEIFVEDNLIILRRYDNAVAIADDLQYLAKKVKEDLPTEQAAKVTVLLQQIGEVLNANQR